MEAGLISGNKYWATTLALTELGLLMEGHRLARNEVKAGTIEVAD